MKVAQVELVEKVYPKKLLICVFSSSKSGVSGLGGRIHWDKKVAVLLSEIADLQCSSPKQQDLKAMSIGLWSINSKTFPGALLFNKLLMLRGS